MSAIIFGRPQLRIGGAGAIALGRGDAIYDHTVISMARVIRPTTKFIDRR